MWCGWVSLAFIRREASVYDPQDIRDKCLHMSRHSRVICGLVRKLDPNARAYDALVMPQQHALPETRRRLLSLIVQVGGVHARQFRAFKPHPKSWREIDFYTQDFIS